MEDGSSWPKISIITPNYNHGIFLEESIRSVLLQGYPNIEYIFVDGGSTDESRLIAEKYKEWFSHFEFKKNTGQTTAVNDGLRLANGEILAWLNSDDYYLPGAFKKIAEVFQSNHKISLVYGICNFVNEKSITLKQNISGISNINEILNIWKVWQNKNNFVQPEVFWRKDVTIKIGLLREDLNYIMDYEYWCRILNKGYCLKRIFFPLACSRDIPERKSANQNQVIYEFSQVLQEYLWQDKTAISLWNRILLQGNWEYQFILQKQINNSLSKTESRALRILRSILTIISHPKIFFSSLFWMKLRSWKLTKKLYSLVFLTNYYAIKPIIRIISLYYTYMKVACIKKRISEFEDISVKSQAFIKWSGLSRPILQPC
jgi:glycosyltransferase involved in cell wall biosynthesis